MHARYPWSALLLASLLAGCALPSQSVQGGDRALAQALETKSRVTMAIPYQTPEQLGSLVDHGLDLWGVTDGVAYGTGSRATLEDAKQLKLAARLETRLKPDNAYDPKYRTYDRMVTDLKKLATTYPNLCKLVDLGDTWEKTKGKADRDIWGLRIGSSAPDTKPGVAFLGEHHARELATSEITYMLAEHLLSQYGKDAEVTFAVDQREIWLVPMVNPDGHVRAEQGEDWRKNADDSNGGGSFQGNATGPGVDLNRNYGYSWDKAPAGSSTRPADPSYRGPAAFSEPETQAVKRLLSGHKFTYCMSYHSFSNLILWPWSFTHDAPTDKRLPAVGLKLAKLAGYKAEQSADLYVHGGTTNDWAYGELGIFTYTSELGSYADGFDPPYSTMARFWQENLSGAMYLLKTADNPAAVFGPELARDALDANGLKAPGAVAAEYFVDQPGVAGQGQPLARQGTGFAAPTVAGRRLVLTHVRDAAGAWGPYRISWSH